MSTQFRLDFDGLDWTGRERYGRGGDWWVFEALAEGATPGNSVPITYEQISGLLDGSLARLDRYGNATATFSVRVVAGNSRGAALGQADLDRRMGDIPRILGMSPPDGWGPRTQWNVVFSASEWEFDDLDEVRCRRVLKVTLTRSPFGHSVEPVTTTFTTSLAAPTLVTLADGTSAANWSSPHGAVTAADGVLQVPTGEPERYYYGTYWTSWFPWEVTFAPPGGIALSTTQYLGVTVGGDATVNGIPHAQEVLVGNTPARLADRSWAGTSGTSANLFFSPVAAVVPSITIKGRSPIYGSNPAPPQVTLDNVFRSTETTATGAAITRREAVGTMRIEGSAPTPITFSVTSPSGGLGTVILYSAPPMRGTNRPDMARWATTRVLDATTISGYRNTTMSDYMTPPVAHLPEGTYLPVVVDANALSGSGLPTFSLGGVTTSPASYKDLNTKVRVASPVELPPRSAGPTSSLSVTCGWTGGESPGDFSKHELLLFWLGDGASLTIVDADTAKGLWVLQPTLGDASPSILVGDTFETALAPAPSAVYAWDGMRVTADPAGQPIYMLATGVTDAVCSGTYLPAWFGMAAPISGA